MRRRSAAVAGVFVGLLTQACGGARACTMVGGTDGLTVEIPTALYAGAGHVVVEVCRQQRCAFTEQVLAATVGSTPTPATRLVTASFHDLGRRFPPGRVQVTATVRRADGRTVGARHQVLELVRRYPNGRSCDGASVSGTLVMTAGDRA